MKSKIVQIACWDHDTIVVLREDGTVWQAYRTMVNQPFGEPLEWVWKWSKLPEIPEDESH